MGSTGGVRPHAEGGSRPLSSRPGGLLVRRARLAARQGTRLVGLPRVLPAAVRLGPAAGVPSALPNPPDSTRARRASGPRRHGPARDRPRRSLRGLDRRLERDGALLRPCAGASERTSPARLPGLRHPLPPGVERRDLRHRSRPLGSGTGTHPPPALRLEIRCARRGNRDPRPDPAREPGLAADRPAPAPRPDDMEEAARVVGGLGGCGRRPPRCLVAAQRGSLRRRDGRSRRTRVGAVLARLPGRQDHLARERRRVAAAWPADRGRGSGGQGAARRAWTCRSPRTWRTGRTTRPFG